MTGLILLMPFATACGDEGTELRADEQLTAKLQELRQAGGSVPLRQLVPGEWDQVHSFAEPVSRELVQHTVGGQIDMGEMFTGPGNILVFTNAGAVQQAVSVRVNVFDGTYGHGVRVVADPPNTGRLQLVDGKP
ncbi:hypothetical protein [Amycolatopsis palatopharyngis]|uniref:hypothetical protein n=1 Tax=Amycolatopsis palatopharyngis TaxID=187982 RepID=UPI000E2264BF|nr:hypothetical protein [Amycolatopsis palatopharyngis]